MSETPLLGLKLQPRAGTPLFEQICQALRRRITAGLLQPGDRLPPSRRLADELGVSRTTILSAYDQLMAEGFAASRRGSGVYVSEIGEVERRAGEGAVIAAAPPARGSRRALPARAPAPLLFHPGQPDMRLFPARAWGRCVAKLARSRPGALVGATHPFGDAELRAEICRYLAEWRGVVAAPEQILITAGSGDALEICLRALAGNRPVALENPGYPPLAAHAAAMGLRVNWLAIDDHGAVPPSAAADPQPGLAVLTPSSQFPLGGAMPQARRNLFLNWAAEHDGWIIEDDYDSEFRYAGQPIPALASLGASERVVYVGSFSKIFSSGFRLGFMVIPKALIPVIKASLALYGGKASIAAQRPLAMFMQSGEFYRHIRRVRRIYAERRALLIGLIGSAKPVPGTFTDHRAGMHITLHLPRSADDRSLSRLAAERGLACQALSSYFAAPPAARGLLLGFCGFTCEELEIGFAHLSEVLRRSGVSSEA